MATRFGNDYYKCRAGTCCKLGSPPQCAHEIGGGPTIDRIAVTKAAGGGWLEFSKSVTRGALARIEAYGASPAGQRARAHLQESRRAEAERARTDGAYALLRALHAERWAQRTLNDATPAVAPPTTHIANGHMPRDLWVW